MEIARLAEALQRLSTRPVATGILPGLICNTGWCQRLLRRAPTVFQFWVSLRRFFALRNAKFVLNRQTCESPGVWPGLVLGLFLWLRGQDLNL